MTLVRESGPGPAGSDEQEIPWMKTVLVTGATGFAGSHILQALSARDGVRPIAACRDPSRLPGGFRGEVRAGDLRDADYLARLLDGVEVVVHAAAWSSLWGHEEHSRTLFLEPTMRLIARCLECGVSRFVNLSTTSAAAPDRSADPMSRGIPRPFWPHLVNVIAIEDQLRACASAAFTAVNLRLGIFVGERYGLGVLPILLPRLRTHLVPWVAGGRTVLPLIDGADIGQAAALAATAPELSGYEGFNVIGPETPTVREVIGFLHTEFGYPRPHFSVPFPVAYRFAWLMERLDPVVPWEPLVTRSIVHLLEETHADNARARERLGYRPRVDWRAAVRAQVAEMGVRQRTPMPMAKPVE